MLLSLSQDDPEYEGKALHTYMVLSKKKKNIADGEATFFLNAHTCNTIIVQSPVLTALNDALLHCSILKENILASLYY